MSGVATRDYSTPGPLTGLGELGLGDLAGSPFEVCWSVHTLVIQPGDAEQLGLPAERFATNQVRPAGTLLEALFALNPAPVAVAREPTERIVGTCRHFAALSCALLRHRGIPARVRCGFATYFQPDQGLDHWVTEYRDAVAPRWIRIDSEVLGSNVRQRADDLAPADFLTGGEAWLAYRRGEIDASTFGVHGTQNWGPAEIRGNAVKDLAALNKIEMLPWDEWGRMTEAYEGNTGADYDELLDDLASVCATDDVEQLTKLYGHPDLAVPLILIR